jgi:outer membrane protein assembly factor BamB/triacylglycerol esterase/lipase EstA (alpha/beta hydrolase family)
MITLHKTQPYPLSILLMRIMIIFMLVNLFVCLTMAGITNAKGINRPFVRSALQNKGTSVSPGTVNQPIIFVHGISQDANVMGIPQKDPFQNAFVPLYTAVKSLFGSIQTFKYVDDIAYADTSSCPARYSPCKSQSSVMDNAVKLDQMIASLYSSSHHKVALIGYSMGAAIIRTSLAGCPQNVICQANLNPKIAEMVNAVFFIAGVQQGSWVAIEVKQIQQTMDAGVSALLDFQPALKKQWRLGGQAVTDLQPQSINVISHNSNLPPNHIRYFNFYGDLQFSWVNCFLAIYCVHSKSVSIGDEIILPGTDDPKETPLWGGARFCLQCNGNNFSQIDVDTSYIQWPLRGEVSANYDDLVNCQGHLSCIIGTLSDLFVAPQMHVNLPSDAALNGAAIQVQDKTGMSGSPTTSVANEIALQLQAQNNVYISSSPTPTTIYIGLLSYDQLLPFYPVDYDSSTAGGTIFALNINNGRNRWYHTFDGNINSVAVFEGIAYMSENGNIYMFNISDGTLVRHFKVGYFIDPPVVVNGVIYVHAINRTGTSSESVFYALNNNGSQIWSYRTGPVGNRSSGETPVVVNKVLYVSTEDGGVYALNTNNGSLLWHTQLDSSDGSANLSSPTVLNGIVYVAGFSSGHLYALNADTGSLVRRSQYNSGGGIASLTASDGVLYISNDVSIYALRASDGHQLWHKQTDGHRNLLTAAGGVVYVSSSFPTNPNSDGSVTYAFRASDGFMLWRTQTQAQAHQASRVPEVVNGIVYVASDYRTGHNIDALHTSDGTLIWESSIF